MDYAKAIPLFLPLVLLNFASGLQANQIQLDPQAALFMGIQTTGEITPVVNYKVGAASWQTTTDPLAFDSASVLQAEGLSNPFLQQLSNSLGAGWSFGYNTAATIADNTFQVGTYEAQGPPPPTTNNDALTNAGFCPSNNCVGAEFFLNYVPTGNDPTTNIHWVQILLVNFATNGAAQAPTYLVDNNMGAVPYYDSVFAADSTHFLDIPFINFPNVPRDFDALTLLVSGPAANTPGQFTIYGGVQWGWSNQATPEPSYEAFFVTLLLVGVALVRVKLSNRAQSPLRSKNR